MNGYVGATLGVVAAAGIAVQAVAIRLATRRGRMVDVLLFNLAISAAIFVGLSAILVREPVLSPRAFLAFAAAGFVSLLVGRAFYFAGIQSVGANRSEPIKSSMPLHATIFAALILGERVTVVQFVGVVLIIAGVVLVTLEGRNADRIAGDSTPWVGLSLPFVAALLFATEPVLASIGFEEGTSVLVGATIQSMTATTFLLAFLAWRRSVPHWSNLPTGDVRWYLLSGVASAATILAYYAGLSVSRVGIVVPISQTSPLLVVALSMLFLKNHERVTLRLVVASCVIIAGAMAVTVAG